MTRRRTPAAKPGTAPEPVTPPTSHVSRATGRNASTSIAAGSDFTVKSKKLGDLKTAEYNPRTLTDEQKQQIRDSIDQFGLVEFVVVNVHPDRYNVVVGGHQRLKVLREMGYTEVQCVEVSLPLEAERQLNVRLNKNTGSWDLDKLATEFSREELAFTGFTDTELAGIFDQGTTGGGGANVGNSTAPERLEFSPIADVTKDYLMVVMDSEEMRNRIYELLGLKVVKSQSGRVKGMQHVLTGAQILQVLEARK